jgi:hypothetical protein
MKSIFRSCIMPGITLRIRIHHNPCILILLFLGLYGTQGSWNDQDSISNQCPDTTEPESITDAHKVYPMVEMWNVKYLRNVNENEKIVKGSLCIHKDGPTRYPTTPVEIIEIFGERVLVADYSGTPLPEHYNEHDLKKTYASGIYNTERDNIERFLLNVNRLVPLTMSEFNAKRKMTDNARIQLLPPIKKSSIYPSVEQCMAVNNKFFGGLDMHVLANQLADQYDSTLGDKLQDICKKYIVSKNINSLFRVKEKIKGTLYVIDLEAMLMTGVSFIVIDRIPGSIMDDEYFENKKNEQYVSIRFAYPDSILGFLKPITMYYIFEKTDNGYKLVQIRDKLAKGLN